MCRRAQSRVTFGSPVAERSNIQDWIAEARIDIEMIRLLTLKAAYLMDTVGNKEARTEIAAIKVAARDIGLAIAQAIAEAGGNVVLTSRSQEAADAAAAQVKGTAVGVGAHAVDEE